MTEKLKYLNEGLLLELSNDIDNNLDRYKYGGFLDLANNNGWGIELKSVNINMDLLDKLEGVSGSEAEVKNSLLVYTALEGMTPSLACEDRIWTRLTHVECFEYSRKRWISTDADDSEVSRSVNVHFFASSQTKTRDDNAVSRLWWNAHIAHVSFPSDPIMALNIILSKADIRSNFIERPWIASRPTVASGLIRAMKKEPWITEKENNYRGFMKAVNKYGGGILFESMNDAQVDTFMSRCCEYAEKEQN